MVLLALASCNSSKVPASTEPVATSTRQMREPRARALRLSGDYDRCVPVVLSADGKRVEWRPEINEVDGSMAPVSLADGLMLDILGIPENASFTRWSYEEYAKLASTPSDAEILDAIVPGACITEVVELPLARGYALRNHEAAMEASKSADKVTIYRR